MILEKVVPRARGFALARATDILEVCKMETNKRSHSVGQSIFHDTWTTKCRYKMFRQLKYKILAEDILRGAAARHGIAVLELNVMSDHVHFVMGLHPSMSVSRAIQLLKGSSAYELFRAVPNFRKRYPRGHFWSAGKYAGSVGEADLETVRRYVKEQVDEFQEQATLADFSRFSGA